MSPSGPNVPGIVVTGILCLVVGAAATFMGMTYYNAFYHPDGPERSQQPGPDGNGDDKGAPNLKANKGGGPGNSIGRGPGSRDKLANLIIKLDPLVRGTLTLNLNEEQEKKLAEQLQGLDNKGELSLKDAEKRFEAILEIVKGQREILEATGFYWPGPQTPGKPRPTDNPFKDEIIGKHLQSLQEKLAKPKGK